MPSVNATPREVLEQENLMLVTIALLAPDARHQIVLNSTDPFLSMPSIELPSGRSQFLSQQDVDRLSWGVLFCAL